MLYVQSQGLMTKDDEVMRALRKGCRYDLTEFPAAKRNRCGGWRRECRIRLPGHLGEYHAYVESGWRSCNGTGSDFQCIDLTLLVQR